MGLGAPGPVVGEATQAVCRRDISLTKGRGSGPLLCCYHLLQSPALSEDAYPSQLFLAGGRWMDRRQVARLIRRPAHLAALASEQVPQRHQKADRSPSCPAAGARHGNQSRPRRNPSSCLMLRLARYGLMLIGTRRPAEVANPSWKPPSRSRRGSGSYDPSSLLRPSSVTDNLPWLTARSLPCAST